MGRAGAGGLTATALVGALLGGCGGDDAEQTSRDAPVRASGEQLYTAHCASCHGADLRGTDAGPSHLSIVYEPNHHSDDAFRLAIANGVTAHHWDFGDMAPVEGLDAAEVDAIIEYVRAVQTREGLEE
ncbi:MAG: c-type cytochrome [Actinomycetota bacterium]